MKISNLNWRGNQHVNRWVWNPVRKYVINPIWKATKVTTFFVSVIAVFFLVGVVLWDIYGQGKAEAYEATFATSTASSTPMTKNIWHEMYESYPIPPMLARICKAEHAGGHFDKNGQVIINATKDMGACQINVPIWGKKASDMGYNLAVEADNREFALWLFLTHGTDPWNSSKANWKY